MSGDSALDGDSLPAAVDGPYGMVGINPKFLCNALAGAPPYSGGAVVGKLCSPVRLNAEVYAALVMPMRERCGSHLENMNTEHFSQEFSYGGARIEYRSFDLQGVNLLFDKDKMASGAVRMDKVVVDGEALGCTSRFGVSFATLIGQSPSIFNLFSVGEVIERARSRQAVGAKALIAIDRSGSEPKALAVSPAGKRLFALPHLERFMEVLGPSAKLGAYAGKGEFKVTYDLTQVHQAFSMHALDFSPNMTLKLAVDGWGKPTAWLSLAIASRGVTLRAQAPAFRSCTNIGEESGKYVSALVRFMRGYSNEEGFGVLHARLEAAHESSASLAEFLAFEKAVAESEVSDDARNDVARIGYQESCRFGFSSLMMTSKKRLVRVPSVYSVASLILLGAEIASNRATGDVEKIYEWIGDLLADSSGFDLEGTLKPEASEEASNKETGDAPASPASLERESAEFLHHEEESRGQLTIAVRAEHEREPARPPRVA